MKIFLLIIYFIIVTLSADAQSSWSVELQGATVYNLPVPLHLSQQGYADIGLTARYSTEPFVMPIYYNYRVSRWNNNRSWEAEFIHHKLYLDNTTEDVQKFNISHGFNMLFINRGFKRPTFRYRAGAGMVIAHPESQIRGQEFGSSTKDNDWGYYLSGPALQVSLNKPLYISNRFYFNAEAKTTFAYSRIKIARGHADVYSIAFHLQLGIGIDAF